MRPWVGYTLAAAGGAALGSYAAWTIAARKYAPMLPPATTSGVTASLTPGGTATVVVRVGRTFAVALPAGSTWINIKDPSGTTTPESGSAPLVVAPTEGTYTAQWMDANGHPQQGDVAVGIELPPPGA